MQQRIQRGRGAGAPQHLDRQHPQLRRGCGVARQLGHDRERRGRTLVQGCAQRESHRAGIGVAQRAEQGALPLDGNLERDLHRFAADPCIDMVNERGGREPIGQRRQAVENQQEVACHIPRDLAREPRRDHWAELAGRAGEAIEQPPPGGPRFRCSQRVKKRLERTHAQSGQQAIDGKKIRRIPGRELPHDFRRGYAVPE